MVSEATNDGIVRMRYILELLGKSSHRANMKKKPGGSRYSQLGNVLMRLRGGSTGMLLGSFVPWGEKDIPRGWLKLLTHTFYSAILFYLFYSTKVFRMFKIILK